MPPRPPLTTSLPARSPPKCFLASAPQLLRVRWRPRGARCGPVGIEAGVPSAADFIARAVYPPALPVHRQRVRDVEARGARQAERGVRVAVADLVVALRAAGDRV